MVSARRCHCWPSWPPVHRPAWSGSLRKRWAGISGGMALTTWLACRGIAKRLGTKQVLHGLDLTVARGEILSILGPSGSGKTTLIRLIAGLSDPDAGEIELAGRIVFNPKVNTRIEQR